MKLAAAFLIAAALLGSWVALSLHEQKILDPVIPREANSRWSVEAVALAPTLPPPDEMTQTICTRIRALRPELNEKFCLIGVTITTWGRLDAKTSFHAMTDTTQGKLTVYGQIQECEEQLKNEEAENFHWIYNPTLHNPFSEVYEIIPDSEACRVAAGFHDEAVPRID